MGDILIPLSLDSVNWEIKQYQMINVMRNIPNTRSPLKNQTNKNNLNSEKQKRNKNKKQRNKKNAMLLLCLILVMKV
jgi:hypothetical protein